MRKFYLFITTYYFEIASHDMNLELALEILFDK